MTVQQFGIQVRDGVLAHDPKAVVTVKTEGASEILDIVRDGKVFQFPHSDILSVDSDLTVDSAIAQVLEVVPV